MKFTSETGTFKYFESFSVKIGATSSMVTSRSSSLKKIKKTTTFNVNFHTITKFYWSSVFWLLTLDRLVTPLSLIPQGTMLPNHFISVLQLIASPWEVTSLSAFMPLKAHQTMLFFDIFAYIPTVAIFLIFGDRIPIAQILLSPIQTPVCGLVSPFSPNSLNRSIMANSSWPFQC